MAGIGFFAPLPIALMLSFMTAQSLMMMLGAGRAWQYGKRQISAMSNEEFNKYTPKDMIDETMADIREMIPSLKQNMQDMKSLQSFIITEMVSYIRSLPDDIVAGFSSDTSNPSTLSSITGLIETAFKIGGMGSEFSGKQMENLARELTTQYNILPPVYADDTSTNQTNDPLITPETKKSYQEYLDMGITNLSKMKRNATGPVPAELTQAYNRLIAGLREDKPPVTKTSRTTNVADKPLGRNEQQLNDTLNKYFMLYRDSMNLIAKYEKQLKGYHAGQKSRGIKEGQIGREQVKIKDYVAIFNNKLNQSRNYPALAHTWGNIKPLKNLT